MKAHSLINFHVVPVWNKLNNGEYIGFFVNWCFQRNLLLLGALYAIVPKEISDRTVFYVFFLSYFKFYDHLRLSFISLVAKMTWESWTKETWPDCRIFHVFVAGLITLPRIHTAMPAGILEGRRMVYGTLSILFLAIILASISSSFLQNLLNTSLALNMFC